MSDTAGQFIENMVAAELRAQTALLSTLLTQERDDLSEIAVLDRAPAQHCLEDFPTAGGKRYLVRRTGNGADTVPVPTSPGVLVLPANEARLGGQIVNFGTTDVILYLTSSKPTGGQPALYVSAGGAWDFRVSSILWAGAVWAVAQTGGTNLCVAEL